MPQPFANPIETPRLLLRRLQRDDAAALCSYRSLPEVARYQSWTNYTLADAERLIADQHEREPGVPGTWLQLALVERATGQLVGDCGVHWQREDARLVELGITLAPSHQGRGYATEGLRGVLAIVFGSMLTQRVCAITDAANARAAKLFERLGFRLEAHWVEHRWFKDHWDSELQFALLRREWLVGATRRTGPVPTNPADAGDKTLELPGTPE